MGKPYPIPLKFSQVSTWGCICPLSFLPSNFIDFPFDIIDSSADNVVKSSNFVHVQALVWELVIGSWVLSVNAGNATFQSLAYASYLA